MATKLQAALIEVAGGNIPNLTGMNQADKELVASLIGKMEVVGTPTASEGESLVKIKTEFSPRKNGRKGDWLCMYYRLDGVDGQVHAREGKEARSATLYGSTRNNLLTVPEKYKKHDIFYALYIGRKLKTSTSK